MATGGQREIGHDLDNVGTLTPGTGIPVEILNMDDRSIQLFENALKDGKVKVYSTRVMVVGHQGVGKTTLIKRLLGKDVNISERRFTEGIDVHVHCCDVSLSSHEWTFRKEELEQDYRLQQLAKVIIEKQQVRSEAADAKQVDHVAEDPNLVSPHPELVRTSQQVGSPVVLKNLPMSNTKTMVRSESGANVSIESRMKDLNKEMLQLLLKNADKIKHDLGKYVPLTICDFAGGYALYTTHQMFLSRRAIYLLVSNISKHLDDMVDDEYGFDKKGKMKCRVRELVEVWMNSVHSCAPPDNKIMNSKVIPPPIILVGTHADAIKQDNRHEICENYFGEIRYHLKDKPSRYHLVEEDFAIDNTVVDRKLEGLKKKIVEVASRQPYWGEEIPARWLLLEQVLMNLRAQGYKVIHRSLLENISQAGGVQIFTDELDLFLRFQHEIGTIIYFSTELLKEKIVLDPQWMIKALNFLITAEMFVLRRAPSVANLWYEFKNGKLYPELVDALWTKDKNADLHDNKDHLLLLMEQLNIIAKPKLYIDDESEIKEVNFFFAPFMLHAEPPREVIFPEPHEQMESSSVMCYVFTGKFLPAPIFHRLLAACVARWPLAKKKTKIFYENQIFCGCGVFQIDDYHKLTLHFSGCIIFMRVTRHGNKDKTPSSKLCIEVKQFIAQVLKKVIGYLGHNLRFEEFIQCPEYNGENVNSLIPVAMLKKNTEVHCDLHDNIIESNKFLKFWFDGEEQPGDSDAYPLLPKEILSMDSYYIPLYKKALQAGMEKVYNIRVMVVGQFGVGKTTLIKRLLGQPVDISERKSTEGIDVHKHCCKISLDNEEWIQQVEDSDQLHTLNRLIKLLLVPDQKPDISQEQKGISQVLYQREITSEIDATKSNVPSTTSVSDQEVQSSTQVSITRGYEIHHLEHLEKETDILAVPLSDAKSSESEKKTKDAMMEILRLVNEKADKLVKDIDKYAALSIWDFAGQCAFYTTHQMFLTSRAIYLLVIDLSQQITDDIKKNDDKCSLDADGIVMRKVFDLFQIWINSIHSIVKSPEDIVPVIVVGTHVDKIPEKSRKEVIGKYFDKLRYMLKDKPTIRHLKDYIAIDNTQPHPMLEELKKRIFELSSHQPQWGEERPARWIPLEQAIMTLKASDTKIVPLSLIEEINMSGSIKIEDRRELELFLQFHHDIGTILHFSVEELRENIVLDPQWIIDALKSLITAETFIEKYPGSTREFYEFIETGKLTDKRIDVIWSKENNLEFHNHKDLILRLLEQLNIIADPIIFSEEGKETKEEHYFLVPCMLQQRTPEEIISPKLNSQMESSPVLCYVFTGNFLPSAIFHRLVAACIAHWPVAKKKKEHGEENLIFCGCCVFQLDDQYKLTLLFREHVIFLRVTRMGIKDKTPSSKLCIEVREFITTNLTKIIGYLGEGLKFEYSIQCPEYNGVCINCLIPVSNLKEKAEVRCAFHDHMIESCKVLDFWFEDQVKNTDCQDIDDLDAPITQEHINHARLCNALTTVCSNAMREILLTNVPTHHTDIYKAILANKAKLKLNKEQVQLVFPDPQGLSTGKVDEFDISLLYTIIRNVSSVPAPSNGWGKPPTDNPRDTTLGASVERIRIYRNDISGHSVDGKISQQQFEDYWAKIDKVLRQIEIIIGNHGYLEDLEKRKNQAITPHEAHELQKTFQEYKKQIEAEASDITSTLKETRSALVTGLQTVEQAISRVEKLHGNQN